MFTSPRALIPVLATVIAITITPYCGWQVISSVMASQTDTVTPASTSASTTDKAKGTHIIAPLPDGSLVEIDYLNTDIDQLIAPFESYADLQIEECLFEQTPGATLMYDGTLMYTDYCRDLFATHEQLRKTITP